MGSSTARFEHTNRTYPLTNPIPTSNLNLPTLSHEIVGNMLLSKGDDFLSYSKYDDAMRCYNEAITLHYKQLLPNFLSINELYSRINLIWKLKLNQLKLNLNYNKIGFDDNVNINLDMLHSRNLNPLHYRFDPLKKYEHPNIVQFPLGYQPLQLVNQPTKYGNTLNYNHTAELSNTFPRTNLPSIGYPFLAIDSKFDDENNNDEDLLKFDEACDLCPKSEIFSEYSNSDSKFNLNSNGRIKRRKDNRLNYMI